MKLTNTWKHLQVGRVAAVTIVVLERIWRNWLAMPRKMRKAGKSRGESVANSMYRRHFGKPEDI